MMATSVIFSPVFMMAQLIRFCIGQTVFLFAPSILLLRQTPRLVFAFGFLVKFAPFFYCS